MRAMPYPSALRVPMTPRSSSTMRVIVVRDTSAATRKNMSGKTVAILSMRSESPW